MRICLPTRQQFRHSWAMCVRRGLLASRSAPCSMKYSMISNVYVVKPVVSGVVIASGGR